MKQKLPMILRYGVGAIFFIFGLNGFLGFIPQPAPSEAGGAFLGALGATGYMFPLIKVTEIVAGALLLANVFVPLALVLLAPITVNIVLFHLILDVSAQGTGMGLLILVAHLILAKSYWSSFSQVLAKKADANL